MRTYSTPNSVAVHPMSKSDPNNRTREQIDENLRRVFQENVEEDLPDRFKDLLAQLKSKGPSTDGGAQK